MPKLDLKKVFTFGLLLGLLVISGCVVSCHEKSPGGTGGVPTGFAGTVTTSLSDPSVCSASIDHVWVTITKVTANSSSTAGPTDSGWVTLIDLTANPEQIDLLNLGSVSCMLAQLGSTSDLPAGVYQQLRLFLLDNAAAGGPSLNNCGFANGFNCVQPHFGVVQELTLSSGIADGIVITANQIARGSFNLAEGQPAEINISFDACASIILQASGLYRLKPALRAGQIQNTGNSISGTVVDSNNLPIPGAVVLVEQPDNNSIDRVIEAVLTASDGTFIFCPLPSGIYDVVASAAPVAATTTVYAATITFQVPTGTPLGNIPLVSEGSGAEPGVPWATLAGQVASVASGGAVAADVSLSALQDATPAGGVVVHVTVPVFSAIAQPPIFTTEAAPSGGLPCPAGKDCLNYALTVPSGNPSVGTFSGGPVTYALPVAGPTAYSLNAASGDCTGANLNPPAVSSISVAPATTSQVNALLEFNGCTQPF